MIYCVDTSGWLDGWQRYYPRDVFPTLWTKIEEHVNQGDLISSEEVYREIKKKDDDLHKWIHKIQAQKSMLVATEERIQLRVGSLLGTYPRLVDTLKNRSQADPFVIATAMERQAVVVTGEKGGTTKLRIPDVCKVEGVRCITFLDMIRELKFTF